MEQNGEARRTRDADPIRNPISRRSGSRAGNERHREHHPILQPDNRQRAGRNRILHHPSCGLVEIGCTAPLDPWMSHPARCGVRW
jgi:hypothetical protein